MTSSRIRDSYVLARIFAIWMGLTKAARRSGFKAVCVNDFQLLDVYFFLNGLHHKWADKEGAD